MPSCFVIMPISMPPAALAEYGGDPQHFAHVLDFLFKPAIEKAGYEMIPPSAKGADLIHAEIVKYLETAELVFCDMSILNPNVFFELGIRTALNRPVCLVRDTRLARVPFDLGMINYHTYDPALLSWKMGEEVDALSKHVKDSFERSPNENPLWKHFGLTKPGEPAKPGSATEALSAKVDLILNHLADLRSSDAARNRSRLGFGASRFRVRTPSSAEVSPLARAVRDLIPGRAMYVSLRVIDEMTDSERDKLFDFAISCGVEVKADDSGVHFFKPSTSGTSPADASSSVDSAPSESTPASES